MKTRPLPSPKTLPQKAFCEDSPPQPQDPFAIHVRDLDFFYGEKQALFDINIDIPRHKVSAFIGPSGCGKSTLLRCFNRMNDRVLHAQASRGQILIEGEDITSPSLDLVKLRREVGMVFQKSHPFPGSIYDNVAYGLRIAGLKDKGRIDYLVETSLKEASLWEEVSHRLKDSAYGLSGGQQQRLCIARSIALRPKILLMDEPCSALDPIATIKVEELMHRLKEQFTLVIVTHNMQQATRISDHTGFFMLGKLIEFTDTRTLFSTPSCPETEDYITGRFS